MGFVLMFFHVVLSFNCCNLQVIVYESITKLERKDIVESMLVLVEKKRMLELQIPLGSFSHSLFNLYLF